MGVKNYKTGTDLFSAIQAGLDNYEPIIQMFRRVLHASRQNVGD